LRRIQAVGGIAYSLPGIRVRIQRARDVFMTHGSPDLSSDEKHFGMNQDLAAGMETAHERPLRYVDTDYRISDADPNLDSR
jgi:hypothetical protein